MALHRFGDSKQRHLLVEVGLPGETELSLVDGRCERRDFQHAALNLNIHVRRTEIQSLVAGPVKTQASVSAKVRNQCVRFCRRVFTAKTDRIPSVALKRQTFRQKRSRYGADRRPVVFQLSVAGQGGRLTFSESSELDLRLDLWGIHQQVLELERLCAGIYLGFKC